ncbi:MAG: lipocalin family protein [Caldimonas sp.]
MPSKRFALAVAAGAAAAVLAACATAPERSLPPLPLAADVDLARFMGDWHVIAAIPTFLERNAYNPVDSYELSADGTVATTFSFNDGAFDGPRRRIGSRGFVVAGTGNAVWGQQYLWPLKADYRISYLAADYSQVIVAREKRDYVWIMARTPAIAAADMERLTAFVAAQGYDASRLRKMPQASPR